jgi:septum formation protein
LADPKLILASSSPRRQSLLRDAGYVFEVDPADIDEANYPASMLPSQVAAHLAESKARAVAARRAGDEDVVILAADTVVAFGDMLLGKPDDAAQARRMLNLLSGTTHLVITGVSVLRPMTRYAKNTRVMSAVKMRVMTPTEIDRYIEGGDWKGKAGGYGIQDRDPFVVRQAGSHTNIVGLPMTTARLLLHEAGITPAPK